MPESREAVTSRLFPNEPFNWEDRWKKAGYICDRNLTDVAVSALAEVGMKPHVEYRGDKNDVLWWDGMLSDDQWKTVERAIELAR